MNLKGINNPNYIDGRSSKLNFCIDCRKEIHNPKAKRCMSCRTKYLWLIGNFRHKKFDNNPNWKGGITDLRRFIYRLDEYKKWVDSIFKRDNYICQECGDKGKHLEAHHIKSFKYIYKEFLQTYSQFSPIEDKETLLRLSITYEPFWDINNGKTLCRDCHKLTNNYKQHK